MNKLPMVIGCQLDRFLSLSTVLGIKVVRRCLALLGIPHHFVGIAAISSNVKTFKSASVNKSGPDEIYPY